MNEPIASIVPVDKLPAPAKSWAHSILLGAILLNPLIPGATSAATPQQLEFFESKVRPVLVEHCYKCHSAGSEKVKGGFTLDTRDGVLRGGDTGPAMPLPDLAKYGDRLFNDYLGAFLEQHIAFPQ